MSLEDNEAMFDARKENYETKNLTQEEIDDLASLRGIPERFRSDKEKKRIQEILDKMKNS